MDLPDRPLNSLFRDVDNGEIRKQLESLVEKQLLQLVQFMQVGDLSIEARNLTLCKMCAKIASTVDLAREFKSAAAKEFLDNLEE